MNEDMIDFDQLNEKQLERLARSPDQFVAILALSKLSIRFKKLAPSVATKVLKSSLEINI